MINILIGSLIAPLIVWLVQNTYKSIRQSTLLHITFTEYRKDIDVRLSEMEGEFDTLIDSHKTSDNRPVRVEDAIVDIRAAIQRSDEQFNAIMEELKQLPRVTAIMEGFSSAIQSIVPRNEIESRLNSAEERLRLVEQDVRGRK